jgi:hypothetical protein
MLLSGIPSEQEKEQSCFFPYKIEQQLPGAFSKEYELMFSLHEWENRCCLLNKLNFI